MAQADGVVANGTGSAVRSDINNQYAALWSNHSGSTEPSSGKVAYQFWADTDTNILKIRNSANNAWINLFTLAGGIDVDAASNFNDDVTFTGNDYNALWNQSNNALEFADNSKAIFGSSQDMEIFHDGSTSIIKDAGTGNLNIQASHIDFINAAGNEYLARFYNDGACELYYNNAKHFQTTSNGNQASGLLLCERASTALKVNQTSSGDVIGCIMRHGRGGLSGFSGKMISFQGNDETEEGSIVIGTTTTAYNTSSDYRLKENQVAISDGITRLKTLKPYRFNFKKDKDTTVDGFFAHEVTPVVPEAIYGTKDATNSDGSINPQQIDQSKLVPLLTAALQQAITKIETLETKVTALEAK